MDEIRPTRSRIETATTPSASPEEIARCEAHLVAWCGGVTSTTERNRMKDIRRFGIWQWGENRAGRVLAWLLDLPATDARDLIREFDRIEARTSGHRTRYRRLHHIRHALRYAAIREGKPIPAVGLPTRDAA